MSRERFAKIHDAFDRHPFWSLMFPAMLPPPTPFKLFVLAAAVFEMQFAHFLLAVFAGRLVRFLILSLLTLKFGPQIVGVIGSLAHNHLRWLVGAVAAGLALWLVLTRLRSQRRESVNHPESE
jgi:membrane protein DedA with SNARE-associated domain